MSFIRSRGKWAASLLALSIAGPATLGAGTARERAEREWSVKAHKMERHLLTLMRQHGVSMWIIMSRENHPDPVLDLFGGYGISGWYGHRNAYIFSDPGQGDRIESAVLGTHQSGHIKRFFREIVSYGEEGLAPHLKKYVAEKNPRAIAVNQSRTISMADGLTVELKAYLEEAIGSPYRERIISSEPLVIDYVSLRTPGELLIEQEASFRTWNILRRAFSNEVIVPGKTTLMDVHWWIVDEWKSQDLEFNFPPGLDIQRQGVERTLDDYQNPVVLPGDVLHVDFGVRLMGLVTDQQKMAYVLRPGETDAPPGLKRAFALSRRAAEIIAEELKPGVAGYLVKESAEKRARDEGIEASVYSHAQGNWVHDAGAWAGFNWPERYGRHPVEPVRATEFWSIEFSTTLPIPEWSGQPVRMLREEDAWVDETGRVHFMAGPQEDLWLIRTFGSGR
jgi:hypothetical protein